MTSTRISFDTLTKSIMMEVLSVFREIITKIIRFKSRSIKRVIFYKNHEEFNDIILDSLFKKLQQEKLTVFLHQFKTSRQEFGENFGSYNTIEKILKILISLDEEKLKMTFQIIRIITGSNSTQSDINSIISSDASANLNTSEKVSSICEENSYNKDIISHSSEDPRQISSKLFLTKKRMASGKYKSPIKNQKLQIPNIFAKTYEMSDKTSLQSLEENYCSISNSSKSNSKIGEKELHLSNQYHKNSINTELNKLNNINIPKPKLTNINTQIQNKYNINVISPQVTENNNFTNFSNNFLHDPGSLLNPANQMNLNLQNNYSSSNIYNKCPKVIIDYDHSSNSDLDHLLVTSGMDKKKIKKTNSMISSNITQIPHPSDLNQNSSSVNSSKVNSIKNTPINLGNGLNNPYHSINSSKGSLIISPNRKKAKQVFFPSEIDSNEIDKPILENEKYKGAIKTPGNYLNFSNPNTLSNGIFNLGGFPQMSSNTNLNSNIHQVFSSCNTPRSTSSNNPYLSDLILQGVKTKDSGIFNQPSERQDKDSVSRNFSHINNNLGGFNMIPGPIPINYTLYNKEVKKITKK